MQITAEAECFLQTSTFNRAIGRLEGCNIRVIADILQDCRVLRNHDTGLNLDSRYCTTRIDFQVVGTTRCFLFLEINGFEIIGKACFAEHDVGCQ
ncbi:hypothetical protein D3C80_2059230 [compost metagenome]